MSDVLLTFCVVYRECRCGSRDFLRGGGDDGGDDRDFAGITHSELCRRGMVTIVEMKNYAISRKTNSRQRL